MVNLKVMFLYRLVVIFIALLLSLLHLGHVFIFPEGSLEILWENKADQYINAYAASFYGNRIAIGKADGKVSVFERGGELIYQHAFGDPVQGLHFSDSGKTMYVQTYNILKVDLDQKAVLWEKFIPNHYINNFWKLNNDSLAYLFSSKTSIDHIFMLTDNNGATLHQFDLPELYDDFESTVSPEESYFFIATESSDLYHMSFDGMVNWMLRLDPPAIKLNHTHPVFFDLNTRGEVCVAYSYERLGIEGHQIIFFDSEGDILWKDDLLHPAVKVQFSRDGKKILVNTKDEIYVYTHHGRQLMDLGQFGYYSLRTEIYFNRLLVNYFSRHSIRALEYLNKMRPPSRSVLRLVSIDQKRVKWQKLLHKNRQHFLVSAEGKVFLEIIKPDIIRMYQYESIKNNKGRCMHGSVEL